MKRDRAVRAVSGRVLARGVAAILQALTLIILARDLGPGVFGLFVTAYSLGIVANALMGFGAGGRVLRIAAEAERDLVLSQLLGMRLLGSAASFTAGLGIAVSMQSPAVAAAVWFASTDGIAEYLQNALAGKARHSAASAAILLQRSLPALGVWLLPLSGQSSLVGLTLGQLAAVGLIWAAVGAEIRRASLPSRRNVRSSRGFWLASVMTQIGQLEPLAVSAVAAPAYVGFYGVAGRLVRPLTIVSGALQSVFVPTLAAEGSRSEFSRLTRRLVSPIWAYAALLVLLSPVAGVAAPVVLGDGYRGVGGLVAAMVVAAALSAVAQGYQSVLLARGRAAASGVVIACASSLGLALILALGVTDAALLWIAPVAAQMAAAVGMWSVANRLLAWPSEGESA